MNATCTQLVECLLKVVSMRLSMSPFFSVKRQPKWVRYKRKIPGVQSLESRRQECQLRPISRLEVSSPYRLQFLTPKTFKHVKVSMSYLF